MNSMAVLPKGLETARIGVGIMSSAFFKNLIFSGTSVLLLLVAPLLSEAAPPNSTDVPEVIEAARKKYGLPDSNKTSNIGNTTVSAVPAATSLSDLVNLQRQSCSWACVTSTFYDYRGLSMYRRHAGLHLGYDIAMQAGTGARAGWPGTVVSIAPWADGEWGVTVASANGIEVTYGHIVPVARLGQSIQVGDIVGTIAINHVDVKMRGADGSYIPFGEGDKQALLTATNVQAKPLTSREQLLVAWLTARNNEDTVKAELEARKREVGLTNIEREKLEKRYTEKRLAVKQMEQYYQDGLVSRREVEQTKQNLEKTRSNLLKVKNLQQEHPDKLKKLQSQLSNCQKRTKQAQKQAQERGLSWHDVQAFVNNLVAGDQKLAETVKNYKKEKQETYLNDLLDAKDEVRQCEAALASQEELFQMGGLPQQELEATRERLRILRSKLEALKKQKP